MYSVLRPIPAERLRLLVFDLDGTLIDSRKDLCNSVNATLAQFHRHSLPEAVIASYIGDGAAMLIRRAFGDPDDSELLNNALMYFLGYYREHKLDYTYTYPGVLEALKTLQAPGRKMAVLTNKPSGPARAICQGLGMGEFFFAIYGGDSFPVKKPDPLGLETLMREAGASPEETVMVGDSAVDVLTGRNAGAWVVGCTFGLAPHTLETAQPDCLVDEAAGWTPLLASRAQNG